MKKYFNTLQSVALFKGIWADDLEAMLQCVQGQLKEYNKKEILLAAGSKPVHVGIVLSGRLHIVKDAMDGTRTLLTTLEQGDIFAEALCCADVEESPVTVEADTQSVVMLMRFSQILHICPNSCSFHKALIANMLKIVAQKNLYLQSRLELIRTKSIRAKVLGYLQAYAAKQGSSFSVPHSREEMADYLCVERSALSHELSRMKKDGLIDYRKNQFWLL